MRKRGCTKLLKREAAREAKNSSIASTSTRSSDSLRPYADADFHDQRSQDQDNPPYELEALAHHEDIPGRHMEIGIAQELNGIPRFRKFPRAHIAYTEGGGLTAS